ncbi:MAG: SufS family cysteine desulfurase [Thermomicrobiales bacterium]
MSASTITRDAATGRAASHAESAFAASPGAASPLDAEAIRARFPILAQTNERGQLLAYLDSAASAQKPDVVLDVLDDYYRRYNANIHRGVYTLSELATNGYETARAQVAAFINAEARECVFVRNTTEAINLVAQTWGRANLRPGDLIVNTVLDHHSNLVPWQLLAQQTGARTAYVPIRADGQLDLAVFETLLAQGPKLVAFSHVSNAVGTVNDAVWLTQRAKAAGATVLIDAAQSAPHRPLDVQALGCDFLALSGHKVMGPMGSGVLFGRYELLAEMPPFMAGGGMVANVTLEGTAWADAPARFEAGTPAVGEAIGLGVAVGYLDALGRAQVAAHEEHLAEMARAGLSEIPGVELHGPLSAAARSGIVGFTVDGLTPGEVAETLDAGNVAVRAGRHCCHPLFNALGLDAIIRASFYVYNTEDDVARLITGVEQARWRLTTRSFGSAVGSTARNGDPCARRASA